MIDKPLDSNLFLISGAHTRNGRLREIRCTFGAEEKKKVRSRIQKALQIVSKGVTGTEQEQQGPLTMLHPTTRVYFARKGAGSSEPDTRFAYYRLEGCSMVRFSTTGCVRLCPSTKWLCVLDLT